MNVVSKLKLNELFRIDFWRHSFNNERMNETEQWIATVTDGAQRVQVATAAGIPHPTLSRQVQADRLTIENLLKIARAYVASIPDTLISHGIVTADELATVSLTGTLADATDQQLLDEIASRLEHVAEGESEVFDSIPAHADATVHDLNDHRARDDYRAAASPISDDDGSDEHYDD